MKTVEKNKDKNKEKLCLDLDQDVFRWKVNGYPALICPPFLGMRETPYGWPKSEILFKNDDCFWYSNWRDIDRNGNLYFRRYLKGRSDFSESYRIRFQRAMSGLALKSEKIMNIDLSSLSTLGFKLYWKNFFDFYNNFWRIVIIPEVASYAFSRRLSVENQRRKEPLSPEQLSILTSFSELSFLAEEEKSLCELALIKDEKERMIKLKIHRNNFYWILNGYHGIHNLNVDFFLRRLEAVRQSKQAIRRLRELSKRSEIHQKEVIKIIKRYRVSASMRRLSFLTQQGSYLQDCRKAQILQASPAIVKLYYELARRMGVDKKSIMYVLPTEIDRCLNGRLSAGEIKARIRGMRFSSIAGPYLYENIDFKDFSKPLESAYIGIGSMISGVTAHPGKVRGCARVLKRVQDCASFKGGEILIALMTSPDYIMAMKKALAIVTDDGGLTCHAAITARELNKPCIVGTRNGTKMIKTGDLVEVDADKGIVKIIK